ncbi:hypothetical protein K505DRAFT_375261 [Melanomma pulvis-pyrius CBS 109.77]|uniref:Uncharacterized protein n=1 Tax=Melanomma pulvis-pyrius CBS 109.77 TaxID=1314802 RepID=A0A6A6XC34_9PLEO|nr:hypothetical protein K505DRAFT_375261 [Melanomma pulvis-pyrius CBS 109.77]
MDTAADNTPRIDPSTDLEATKPNKRLSKRITKRFSAPVPVSKKEGKRMSITSTFSLPIFPRSSSAPSPSIATSTSTLSTKSSPSTTPTTLITTSTPGPLPPPTAPYKPILNYIPCLYPHCTTHYLPPTLGPTFYAPQAPYNLSRTRGYCPSHASKDLRQANARCKKEWESMRQNAGRKTLGLIDAEFEIWVQRYREERGVEGRANEARMIVRVVGVSGAKGKKGGDATAEKAAGEWDWKYAPRPCTKKNCVRDWYSIFDQRFHLFYITPRKSGLTILQTLCPACARRDIGEAEKRMTEKWREMHPQQWREWMERLKRERATEQAFWEMAQERRVRERAMGVGAKLERGQEKKDTELELEGKGVDALKELCVVM